MLLIIFASAMIMFMLIPIIFLHSSNQARELPSAEDLVKWKAVPMWERLLTFKDGKQYRGSGSCWDHYPSGKYCDTYLCSRLSEICNRIEWGFEDDKEEK